MKLHEPNLELLETELSIEEWDSFYTELTQRNEDLVCVDIAKILVINNFIQQDPASQKSALEKMKQQCEVMDRLSKKTQDIGMQFQSNKIRYVHNLFRNNTEMDSVPISKQKNKLRVIKEDLQKTYFEKYPEQKKLFIDNGIDIKIDFPIQNSTEKKSIFNNILKFFRRLFKYK